MIFDAKNVQGFCGLRNMDSLWASDGVVEFGNLAQIHFGGFANRDL